MEKERSPDKPDDGLAQLNSRKSININIFIVVVAS